MDRFTISILSFLLLGVCTLCLYLLADHIITQHRIGVNQKEWDTYSKGMDTNEKIACFNDFLVKNKARHQWRFLYIPKM